MPGRKDRKLHLTYHGRIIDHLGIQMYQSPVAAIAELVANAWDADAEIVEISLPDELSEDACIVLKDNGLGMSFDECEHKYLNVGWARRGDNPDARSPEKDRPILGRKGIGKFAGFGIAEVISIETVSKVTGERTVFELDLNQLRGEEYVHVEGAEIDVVDYLEPSESRKEDHGTTVTLKALVLGQRPSLERFSKSMARRFLLHQQQEDFRVLVNGALLPESLDLAGVEYLFPRDYRDDEMPETLGAIDEDGWGSEALESGQTIRWRFLFHRDTLDEEELRGIAVFTKGKLAQSPFLFNLTGGLGGQHGVAYLTGQVEADYLDLLQKDIIAPERQRINWGLQESNPLLAWGQRRVKELLRIWRERRGEARVRILEEKISGFTPRLEKLGRHEARTIGTALRKLAQIETLKEEQFKELGDAVLTTWEQGRLRDLIADIANADSMSEEDLLRILLEAQVLTALNTAEAVKTKLQTVGGLKLRIENRELEAGVRDYIANSPWLISPEWETYKVETSVRKLIEDAAEEAKLLDEEFKGRIDLVLSSGTHLLVLEFMRPGLNLNWDHLQRFERYVLTVRANIDVNTGGRFTHVTGYVVADGLELNAAARDKIKGMQKDDMFALDWGTLFGIALATWQEFLQILAGRAPDDERLRTLLDEPKVSAREERPIDA